MTDSPRTFLREVARRIWGDGWPGEYEAVSFEGMERRPRWQHLLHPLDVRAQAVDELYQVRITELLQHNTELVERHRAQMLAVNRELDKANKAWEEWQEWAKRYEETAALATALTLKERKAHVEDRKTDWLNMRRMFWTISRFLEDLKPALDGMEVLTMKRAAVANAINEWGRQMDTHYGVTREEADESEKLHHDAVRVVADIIKEESNGTS